MNEEIIILIFDIFVYIGFIVALGVILWYRQELFIAENEIEILEKELRIEKKEIKKLKNKNE